MLRQVASLMKPRWVPMHYSSFNSQPQHSCHIDDNGEQSGEISSYQEDTVSKISTHSQNMALRILLSGLSGQPRLFIPLPYATFSLEDL